MIKIFTDQGLAITFNNIQNTKYGSNYTTMISNTDGDKWLVQILKSDYDNLTSEEQQGFVSKIPDDWFQEI